MNDAVGKDVAFFADKKSTRREDFRLLVFCILLKSCEDLDNAVATFGVDFVEALLEAQVIRLRLLRLY